MSTVYRKRWELIFLVKHAKGPHMTTEAAAKYLKMSRSWAINLIKQFEESSHVDFLPGQGRKRATTEKQDQQMVKMAVAEKPSSTQQIADSFTSKGVELSRVTVSRRLKEHGLRYKSVLSKPLLKDYHISRRFAYGVENLDRDWTRVVFSDETTFELSCQVTHAWQKKVIPGS